MAELDLVTGEAAKKPILDVESQANWQNAHHHLYAVELTAEVFSLEHKFREANRGYRLSVKPRVYVGLTDLTPEARSQEHCNGNHSARFVKKYGVCLLPERYKHFNPIPFDLAAFMEVERVIRSCHIDAALVDFRRAGYRKV